MICFEIFYVAVQNFVTITKSLKYTNHQIIYNISVKINIQK